MTDTVRRIYLDHAATSFPKPPEVIEAMQAALQENGTAYGRGATRAGLESRKVVDRCRERAARLFGTASANHIIWTFNGTDSLNLAIHGLVRQGDHVLTTTWEHNSVLRPLKLLERTRQVSVDIVSTAGSTLIDPGDFAQACARQTPQIVVINHASNVTGTLQPVADLIPLAKQAGAKVIVDVAQSAGHVPVDRFLALGADLLACPGHKGLLGPLGTGLLALGKEIDQAIDPIRQGGTGTLSESTDQPATLPDKYEPGNHNVPGLWGLEAGLAWIEQQSVAALRTHELDLLTQLLEGLQAIPRVMLYGEPIAAQRVGVISFNIEGIEPHIVAAILEEHFGVEVRAGFHFAPRAHEALGTVALGGTVRLSPGRFTTSQEIDATLEAIGQIALSL